MEHHRSGALESRIVWNGGTDPQYIGGADVPVLPDDFRIDHTSVRATEPGTFDIGDGIHQARNAAAVTIGTECLETELLARLPDAASSNLVFT